MLRTTTVPFEESVERYVVCNIIMQRTSGRYFRLPTLVFATCPYHQVYDILVTS